MVISRSTVLSISSCTGLPSTGKGLPYVASSQADQEIPGSWANHIIHGRLPYPVMRVIRAPSAGRAHELVVRSLLEKGTVIDTEDDEATVEGDEIAIRIEHPLTEPMVSPASRFQQRFMEQYAADLLTGSGGRFEYDYHDRLFHWGQGLTSLGHPISRDQVAYIIQKLGTAPVSRRAIAVTWNPAIDEELDDCPCLQLVQCLARGGSLHMKVVFRSNDMLSAAGANMFALISLQKHIADRLGLNQGAYTHISLVPHIYYKRDSHDILPFCNRGAEIRPLPEVCRSCGRCPRGTS